jgi:YebC/PmpR family DNA-binding regulatory protein
VIDLKRGKIFSKLIREIAVAARQGTNIEVNARLRNAIQRAKSYNMPSDTIERALRKGSGELEGKSFEEITYEGYGPGGVAILVEALTDNRNRTTSAIRNIFSKRGGNLGESGCVGWLFEKKGHIIIEGGAVSEEKLLEVSVEKGAEDIKQTEDGTLEVITSPADFESVREGIEKSGIPIKLAEITMIPQTTVRVDGKEARSLLSLIQTLEDDDDVQNVYANFDIPDALLEEVGST